MAKLSKKSIDLSLRKPASDAILITTAAGETVKRADWIVHDLEGATVTLPGFTGRKDYTGARAQADADGFYIRGGDAPVYAQLTIECIATIKDRNGATDTKSLGKATVRFHDYWGGMAKAWYPYPDDYEVAWNKDAQGRRAVALMHEAIALLPDEFRKVAGSIPIIRTADDSAPRGGQFNGAHLPFFFDTIQISSRLVDALDDVPRLTDKDIQFVTIVIHEIGHAATYRNCLWGTHQQVANIRKYMRKPFVPVVGALPAAVALVPAFILAAAQELVAPRDIVSDFSEVAGWELAHPIARVARYLHPVQVALPTNLLTDIGQWLSRLPSAGPWQDNPIRPNVAVGNQEIGAAFGLQIRGLPELKAESEAKQAAWQAADAAWKRAGSKQKAAAQKKRDAAERARDAARIAYADGMKSRGLVSDYAASDTLEDMAETLAFFLVDPTQLGRIGDYFGDRASRALKAKRKFFVDNGYLPARQFKPAVVGSYWRGYDANDHLNLWRVEL